MAAFHEKQLPKDAPIAAKALNWVDARFPLTSTWKAHLSEYYAPKNFNFWYAFGSLALLVLVIQIVTGIFLVMHYKPDATLAFASVEYIMRDVPWGWLVRYMHSTGASAFFIVVYLHMVRGLLYGSYRKPRELVWLFGVGIFLCLMGEAFMGYLLPWGQMSYWGAQVIVNLFGAIPFIGPDLSLWIRGDYVVSDATLNRFFSFHVIAIPLVLIGLVAAHIIALHEVGSNNPDGIEIKETTDEHGVPLDGVPFHPFYSVHDIMAVAVFLLVFSAVVFFAPEMGGYFLEYNNFIPADSLKTPPHIAPVWYFTPFYSILRATTSDFMGWLIAGIAAYVALLVLKTKLAGFLKVAAIVIGLAVVAGMLVFDAKFWGVVLMGVSVMILGALPWLDHSQVKSIRYRPGWHKYIYIVFGIAFIALGYLGVQPPTTIGTLVSQVCTFIYFGFFLLMPWWSAAGTFKPVPDRVTFHPH
ncbi:cytochrome bc complex cytochrome b subunit [Herbaspirillum lusitanum]|uniref:Cytochrome b n=1 Tax=Herbaspirillum lusitanum TaxID=213312 RepID=A0ABW9ACF7_9BURK